MRSQSVAAPPSHRRLVRPGPSETKLVRNMMFDLDYLPGVSLVEEFVVAADEVRILIVDRDAAEADRLSAQLESQGYRIHQAATAHGAVEAVRRFAPRIIVLEPHLPDADGFQFCSALSDHPSARDAAIIMIAQADDPSSVAVARSAGARYFLAKPFDPNVLLATIEAALREGADDFE